MYVIYALVDPRDYSVHYVGQTGDVYERFKQHINGDGSFAKNAWIFELRAVNRMVIMETLEEVETYQKAVEREVYWIRHFEMLKEPLSNVTHRASLKKLKKGQMKAARHAASQVLMAIDARKTTESLLTEPPLQDDERLSKDVSTNGGIQVSDEKKALIKALYEMGIKHNQIAKAVKLEGRNYPIYQQVCRELGIATTKREA